MSGFVNKEQLQRYTDGLKGKFVLKSELNNIKDGNATGSLIGIDTTQEDDNYSIGQDSVALGLGTKASGFVSYAEGYQTTASGNFSHAEGDRTTANGFNSHAEGTGTTASGSYSHAEGGSTIACDYYSHAEGYGGLTKGNGAHTEGYGGTGSSISLSFISCTRYHYSGQTYYYSLEYSCSGDYSQYNNRYFYFANQTLQATISFSNNVSTFTFSKSVNEYTSSTAYARVYTHVASGQASHVEGMSNLASGQASHAEGGNTISSNYYTHAEGQNTSASGYGSHAEGGNGKVTHQYAHIEGWGNRETLNLTYSSQYTFTVNDSKAYLLNANVLYNNSIYKITSAVYNRRSTTFIIPDLNATSNIQVEVYNHVAGNEYAHVEGLRNQAYGADSHAEGSENIIEWNGMHAHAEGYNNKITSYCSHAEGNTNIVSGQSSHAEGEGTTASGQTSHAEGYKTTASGVYSHAEGGSTTASGNSSHAEGGGTTASGTQSHAEGNNTKASGYYSHAEGNNTTASHKSQHIFGEYNIADTSSNESDERGTYVEIVGNGTADDARSNARTLDWQGNETLAGNLTIGGTLTVGGVNVMTQSDWEQNDSTAIDYVKNRTHYTETESVTCMDEDFGSAATQYFDFSVDIVDGETYTMTITGSSTESYNTTEELTAADPGDGNIVLRNSNGISITLWAESRPSEMGEHYGSYNGPGNMHVNVSQNEESVVQLDDKYISDNIARTSDLIQNFVDGSATGSLRSIGSAAEDSSYTMGINAFAEGSGTKASGYSSHAEGNSTTADGTMSHAEGSGTTARGTLSHAEGGGTTASGPTSHAEGNITTASGNSSHAEGEFTIANHKSQHVFGEYNEVDTSSAAASARGTYVEIVGNGTADDSRSNARTLDWDGNEELAGNLTVGGSLTVNGQQIEPQAQSDWNQNDNTASDFIKNRPFYQIGEASLIGEVVASTSMVQFELSTALIAGKTYTVNINGTDYSVNSAISNNLVSLATTAGNIFYDPQHNVAQLPNNAFIAGPGNGQTIKIYNYVEIVKLDSKFLDGSLIKNGTGIGANIFNNSYNNNTASGRDSSAFGRTNTSSGECSASFGSGTTASGDNSHAEGSGTIANHSSQHVFGEYNIEDPSTAPANYNGTYIEIVGNGTADDSRSNARTLDWQGNETLAGNLTIGGTSGATLRVDNGNLQVSFDGGTTWYNITVTPA